MTPTPKSQLSPHKISYIPPLVYNKSRQTKIVNSKCNVYNQIFPIYYSKYIKSPSRRTLKVHISVKIANMYYDIYRVIESE